MVQNCGKCNRVNPREAAYCYFDGSALPGARHSGGNAAHTANLFPTPFVFPRGRSCRTFDELAVACHEHWPAARALLRQGYFESFLHGLGRKDLAQAASDAAHYLDADRGLDQLLARLPTRVLDKPKLRVSPRELHLGQIKFGENRTFDLRLENQGMRLLYGSVSCEECNWLTLGDAKGAMEKHFQFGAEAVIAVHVLGHRLRASIQPLEGRLIVDSNGGTEQITIWAEVPPKPFRTGVLAGARSPRQLAEKARQTPKEAADYFESGAVARWYKDNGWTYPVSGPAFRGPAAVQQFFEVLGLATPPKVELSENSITLRGAVGEALEYVLQVRNTESRPRLVFAHAVSNQPWLEIGQARLNGSMASIPLVVRAVPDHPGTHLTARVVVLANGNQRFVVPVSLHIGVNRPRSNRAVPVPGSSAPRFIASTSGSPNGHPSVWTRMRRILRNAWPLAVSLPALAASSGRLIC
jgi:hypothetical protein